MNQSELRAQPDQTINAEADQKIYGRAPVSLKSLMTQRLRKVRN